MELDTEARARRTLLDQEQQQLEAEIKRLKSENRFEDAIRTINAALPALEDKCAQDEDASLPTWHYRKLAILYRKVGKPEQEVAVLDRYLLWHRNRNQPPDSTLVLRWIESNDIPLRRNRDGEMVAEGSTAELLHNSWERIRINENSFRFYAYGEVKTLAGTTTSDRLITYVDKQAQIIICYKPPYSAQKIHHDRYRRYNNGSRCVEVFDGSSSNARVRSAQLRKLGYTTHVIRAGQVMHYRVSLVDIQPGIHPDTWSVPEFRRTPPYEDWERQRSNAVLQSELSSVFQSPNT
jgi:hypothetical protein